MQAVRKTYGEVAKAGNGCGCGWGSGKNLTPEEISVSLGYSNNDVSTVPEGANMGWGSGNPQAIADIVAIVQLPDEIKNDLALHSACVAGAQKIEELRDLLEEIGFINISIKPINRSKEFIQDSAPDSNLEYFIASASIEAVKP